MLCRCVRSFENIQLEADNGIPTKPFLSSCSSILPFLGEFADSRGCSVSCVRIYLLSYCVQFSVVASDYLPQAQTTEGEWKHGNELCCHRKNRAPSSPAIIPLSLQALNEMQTP